MSGGHAVAREEPPVAGSGVAVRAGSGDAVPAALTGQRGVPDVPGRIAAGSETPFAERTGP